MSQPSASEREAQRQLRRDLETPAPHDFGLHVVEAARICVLGGDPADYASVPVEVQLDVTRQGGMARIETAPGAHQDVVMIPMILIIPSCELSGAKASKILLPDGTKRSPVEGMLPSLIARLVIPRARLSNPPTHGRLIHVDDIEPRPAPKEEG